MRDFLCEAEEGRMDVADADPQHRSTQFEMPIINRLRSRSVLFAREPPATAHLQRHSAVPPAAPCRHRSCSKTPSDRSERSALYPRSVFRPFLGRIAALAACGLLLYRPWVMQKRLNRSRGRSGRWLGWTQETVIRWGPDPTRKEPILRARRAGHVRWSPTLL